MKFKNLDMYALMDSVKEKTLICFGAGTLLRGACMSFSDISFFDRIDLIADNAKDKHGFSFSDAIKAVHPIEECLRLAKKEPAILITMEDFVDVIEQLDSILELKNCDCFIYSLVQAFTSPYKLPQNRSLKETLKIPKTIHYCWFGGNPIRDDFATYMETWKKFCPEYEIVRWDESNYDYKKNEYMYEAYKNKRWGFVSDFARLDIIYKYGGVYLDTDVELIKNIDDLLCDNAFCGFDRRDNVNNGVGFGAIASFPLIGELIDKYGHISFLNKDGSLNLTPGPRYHTELFCSKGLKLDNTLQKVQGMTIYPIDVLAPLNWLTGIVTITENTFAIHHYSATWCDAFHRERMKNVYRKYKYLLESR